MSKINSKILKDLCSSDRNIMESSFLIIYKEYYSLIYYVVFEILRNKEDAEDISNETFYRMYSYRRQITNEKTLKALLAKTAKNLAYTTLKNNMRTTSLDVEVEDTTNTNDEFNALIEKFKVYVDEDELYYIICHLYLGMSFKDIATEKNVTVSTVSSKYRRGIEKLKTKFKRREIHE